MSLKTSYIIKGAISTTIASLVGAVGTVGIAAGYGQDSPTLISLWIAACFGGIFGAMISISYWIEQYKAAALIHQRVWSWRIKRPLPDSIYYNHKMPFRWSVHLNGKRMEERNATTAIEAEEAAQTYIRDYEQAEKFKPYGGTYNRYPDEFKSIKDIKHPKEC